MKTFLLVYIHGFQGGSDTFVNFPQDVQAKLEESSNHEEYNYLSMIYPPYDTRGDFKLAVSKLREWIQNVVIDLESQRGTRSPMLNSSIQVILLGHSMGGLVASDVVLDIHAEYHPAPLFPHVIGIICLDSPVLGLAPSVWTNSADGIFQKGKSFYEVATGVTALGSGLFAGKAAQAIETQKAIEAGPRNSKSSNASLGWKSIAAISAASVVAAGGALYSQKETLGRGYSWVTGHLEFVGVLRKPEELSQRTLKINSIPEVHFSLYYTTLGPKRSAATDSIRTFVVLPRGELLKSRFHSQVNEIAEDEVAAHTSMFSAQKNSGYALLRDQICAEIHEWVAASLVTHLENAGQIQSHEIEA